MIFSQKKEIVQKFSQKMFSFTGDKFLRFLFQPWEKRQNSLFSRKFFTNIGRKIYAIFEKFRDMRLRNFSFQKILPSLKTRTETKKSSLHTQFSFDYEKCWSFSINKKYSQFIATLKRRNWQEKILAALYFGTSGAVGYNLGWLMCFLRNYLTIPCHFCTLERALQGQTGLLFWI